MHHKVHLSYSWQVCTVFIQVTIYLMVLMTILSLLLSGSDHHSKLINFVYMVTFCIFALINTVFALELAVQHQQTQDPHYNIWQ